MELHNSFVVPAGIDAAWERLLDVESVAPCMPGAKLTSHEGDEFAGDVKVKLGPVSMVYSGTAKFVSKDPEKYKAVIAAAGKEAKGQSTARATVVTTLVAEAPDQTRVQVDTDLAITGRPAQFGRGVMEDVAGRIINQFADCLSMMMSGAGEVTTSAASDGASVDASAESSPAPSESVSAEASTAPSDDAINLIGTAGVPVLKRLAPVVAVLVGVIVVVWWLKKR